MSRDNAATTGLELRDIDKLVDRELQLSDISLSFPLGSFTTLLGRLRAGKTSLLRIMAGLDRPSRGRVAWNGSDVTHEDVRKRDAAMVYQQFVNYPAFSVFDNIASPLRVQARLDARTIDKRVREIAERLHIEKLLDRLPAELSGGQQQRTAIGRALAKSAKLVLLDEPLANLDYKLREELRNELRGYFGGEERAVVYATAEPREALELGGACAVLHEGTLLQHGPVAEVYDTPSSELVARIITDPEINVFDVTVLEDHVHATQEPAFTFARHGELARLPLGAARIGVRAHDLSPEPHSPNAIKLRVEVTLEELSGSETLVRAQSSGGLEWTAQWQGTRRAELGAQLDLFIDPNSLLLFNASGLAWRV
ncbi:MAG TPA: ABC transporter ATP-binding protein [Polyangiales bacterium]|nr:ABC transporter ATP-binding protein [Polyangiales bacterium]